MANTKSRERVHPVLPNSASRDDPDIENNLPTDNEDEESTIEDAKQLRRKERRRLGRNPKASHTIASSTSSGRTPSPSDSDTDATSFLVPPTSRKDKRKQKKNPQKLDAVPAIDSRVPAPHHSKPNRPSKKESTTKTPLPLELSSPLSTDSTMPPTTYYPLLICSIGNPGAQYAKTLHSAGHTILDIVRERGLYTPFTKGLSGLMAEPNTTRYKYNVFKGFVKDANASRELASGEDDFILWKSTKLMNISGQSVKSAWTNFSTQQRARGLEGRLVVVHDELEAPLGQVKIREGTASPKGHNGLKSCQASLGNVKWWRVGVGIGRPESRDPAVVSKYVLRKMNYGEEKAMDRAAVGVLRALRDISEGSV